MGALTLCLGSSYQVLHLAKQSCSKLPVARSFSWQNPLPSQGFLFLHSYSFTLIPKYSQKQGRIAHQCSSSAAWPYERWDETTEDDGGGTTDYSSWPRIVISQLDGGFEVLAMGFGVAVSVALAVSRSIPPSGLPVAALTLAVLVGTITTLRFQIGRLWRKIKEIVDVATNHRFRSYDFQFGLNKVASNRVERFTDVAHKGEVTSKDKEASQLLLRRNSVQTMQNGAAIGVSHPSNYHPELAPSPTSLSSTGEENQVMKDVNDANKSPAPDPGVEVIISDMAKCVAQLAVVVARLEEKITNLETKNAQNSAASLSLKQTTSADGNGSATFAVSLETVEKSNAQKPADLSICKSSIVEASPLQQADSLTNGNSSQTFAVTMENVENRDAQEPADLVIRDGNNSSAVAITVENVENSPLDLSPLGHVNMVTAAPWTGVFSDSGEENWVSEPLRKLSLEVKSMAHQGKSISTPEFAYKEKSLVSARNLELQATASDAGWNEYSMSSGSMGNGRKDNYDDGTEYPVGAARSIRGQQRTQAADDEETSYNGSRMRAGPADNWDGLSSSRGDPREKWQRDITDVDFGGNGSSGEDSEGGRRRWGKGSTQSSDTINEAGDKGTDVPVPQETGSSAQNNPSYPLEQSETYQNLAVLKKKNPDDDRFQQILDEVEALLNEGREGLEGRIEVGVAEQMLYEASDLCAKAVALRPSSLVGLGLWGNTLLLHGELKLRLTQNLRSILPEPSSSALNRRDDWEADEERQALEATIQEVSEECEQLLVEAGRKYRSALSVDRTDMRALYNWGLALCYRGQLISEEGGETSSQDADKVYLAAIDKFEAMMGLSDKYACGALLNWGLAMRDRSRLRPMGSKERIKLMVQAREIFQEALRLDPNYGQARGAVAACNVELRELQEYEEPRETRGLSNWWGR